MLLQSRSLSYQKAVICNRGIIQLIAHRTFHEAEHYKIEVYNQRIKKKTYLIVF